MKRLILLLSIISLSLATAEEGMWLLDQISDIDLEEKGFEISAAEIYTPGEACVAEGVIKLGGGTASFVSSEGLVLTNHHVAFGAVQRASTRGTDYLTDGFLAAAKADEIEAPGYYALLLEEMRDVTTEVLVAAEGIDDPVEHAQTVRAKITAMVEDIESQGEDIQADIRSMYFGKQYMLFIHKRFDDIRVVYMPPQAIGNYGADIDNWMWPRHTGDFAFVRVYASPEGVGRSYSPENVPYRPRTWLKVATDDLNEGDMTFIIGYPGINSRYRFSNDISYYQKLYYPARVKQYQQLIALLDSVGQDSPLAAMKVAGLTKGLNNYMKKYTGVLNGMEKYDFLNAQIAKEDKLKQKIRKKRKLRKTYGDLFDDYDELYAELNKRHERDDVLAMFNRVAGTLPVLANRLYYTVKEREKPVVDRDPKFSEADLERYLKRLKYEFYSYYEPAQIELLKYTLDKVQNLQGDLRITGLDYLVQSGNPETELQQMFSNSRLNDPEYALALFDLSSREIEAIDDPFIKMAISMYPDREEKRAFGRKFSAIAEDMRRQYLDLVTAIEGIGHYPEANSTKRFTYGKVTGYRPRDAVHYKPFTTVDGMIDKHTGVVPFNVPEKLRGIVKNEDFGDWIDPSENTATIAFTHACDITNGNSGSPVLNGKGELIGCAFDGNFEALLSDWKYDQDIQRTISVDIRYVMLITEKYAQATHILAEMEIE